MAYTMQDYLATRVQKIAEQLVEAYLSLPQDKRDWTPDDKARSAIDMIAECALANGSTVDLVREKAWPESGYDDFMDRMNELTKSWDTAKALLDSNTAILIETIRNVPEEDLKIEIPTPWQTMTMEEIISYPVWNMSYHEGQINYIASILGCLK